MAPTAVVPTPDNVPTKAFLTKEVIQPFLTEIKQHLVRGRPTPCQWNFHLVLSAEVYTPPPIPAES